ncbi:MAG: hypothetical protein J6K64_02530 [Clostridia bacterium]|nr:hypothetical protein [Clostridia bacterium]
MKIKAKKGCTNPECIQCKKKEHAHKDDLFCPRCGGSLNYVCEKCHTVLADGSTKLCVGCQAKKDDAKEKRNDRLGKIGGGALAIAATVPGIIAAVVKKK